MTSDRDALAPGAGRSAVLVESTTADIDYAATLSNNQDAQFLSGGIRLRF